MTRPEWLRLAVRALRVVFAELELEPPPYQLVVTAGRIQPTKDNEIGWSWTQGSVSYIALDTDAVASDVEILAVLAHELIHCAVGVELGHNGAFRPAWRKLGYEGLPTEVAIGEPLQCVLEAIASQLGPWPPA